jgi:hypothetical protein
VVRFRKSHQNRTPVIEAWWFYKKRERAGKVAQVAECPPSKHEAQSSNPSTIKIKKKKKEIKGRELGMDAEAGGM